MSEYKRLTTKDEEGNWQVWEDDYSHPFEALQVAIDRLAELEDAIEQGTLIEVVRCKDCRFLEEKHYEDEGEKPYIKLVCKLLKKQFQPNDFCSYAEKRLKELQG